jgi:hypothetical protein
MPESVTYSSHEHLINVKSTGNLTKEEVRVSMCTVAKFCKETGARKVFVDQLDAKSFPDNAFGFNLGSDVAHLLKGVNIALVHSHEVRDDIKFLEKVAQKRGGNIKVFSNVESAKSWLSNF